MKAVFLSLLRWSDQAQRQDVLGLPAVEVRLLRCTDDGEVRRHGGEVLASIYFSPVSLNRRAVRAKVVSPVALTYFHRFRSRLDGPVPRQVQQLIGPAGYLVQVGVWHTLSALAATSSPNTLPQPLIPTLVVMIVERCL